jgi:stage IV sporulation protein FB
MDDFFKWKFPVGRIFGMTIRVHIIYVLFIIGLALRFSIDKNAIPGTWQDALLLAAITTLFVLLHEMGHCFGARAVGGEADDIMLWPLGGIAEVSYLPANPWAHFVCVAGGPLVNVILCVLSALALAFCFDQPIRPNFNFFDWWPFRIDVGLYRVNLWNGSTLVTGSLAIMLLAWTFYINWFLFVFNMVLVGLPFDGGGLVRSMLWPYIGFHRATMYMVTTGFIISGLMFMSVFVWEMNGLAFLSVFTFMMCRREWMMLEGRGEESLFGYDFSAGYTSLEKDMPAQAPPRKKQNFIQRYLQKRNARRMQREQELQIAEERRMDELLEKIQREGKQSLTDDETRFLKRVSDRYRNRH